MKYIRTKDGIYEYVDYDNECIIPMPIIKYKEQLTHCAECDIIKQADTIEELCDEFIGTREIKKPIVQSSYVRLKSCIYFLKKNIEIKEIYGAIWTEWGLKYIAKMNDKGVLELL